MDILTEEKPLFEVDEDRLNELMQLSRQFYPHIPEWFLHGVCTEQCMIEKGYEPDQALADELYQKSQDELKKTEYYFNVEPERQTSELLN
jgi:hypothetical protein